MRLFTYELKKILSGAAIWIFVGLCIAFNIWTMPNVNHLELDTTKPFEINVFEDYDTSQVAEIYISAIGMSGAPAERMRAKYADLQIVVEQKAISGVSYSPYFGEDTFWMHFRLFNSAGLIGRLLFQGILLAVLMSLLAIGYEQINNTEHSVYTTKTGRNILRHKVCASLIASIGVYALISIITFAVYFGIHDYSNVWSSSVSSGFNFIYDLTAGARPFTTWQSFTVASYLWASIGISLGLLICFVLMGVIIGIFSKNGYIGFLVLMLISAFCLLMPFLFSESSYIRYILFHTPVGLGLNSGMWFTDGFCGNFGFMTLWRNFELWGTGISLLILIAICIFAVKRFQRVAI